MAHSVIVKVRATLRVLLLWFTGYVAGSLASVVALFATGRAGSTVDELPVWVIGVSVVAMWGVYVAVFPRLLPFEEQSPVQTYRRWFTSRDAWVGIPAGILGQLVLVNLVNWPLSKLFPDTFSFDDVSKRAEDLANTAPGAWVILLVVIVVVGAPVVEEIVYRGSLHTNLVSTAGTPVGLVLTAAVFAAIHLEPIEFPGLFAFALLLGVLRQWSGTLGMPILTHVAFNATGLILVSLF
jgi:membrane protease YdiL (CAAX protease family)